MQYVMLVCIGLSVLYGAYFAYIAVAGNLKKARGIAWHAPVKKIAVVLPARNEARVLGYLIDSLHKQDYPKELMDIYVVPNNCTDDTELVARRAGARVIACENVVHSKGQVLREAFGKLLERDEHYDAFVVFDADNVVDPMFLQSVNNALCAGYHVGQGYRDSKNPQDSWIAGCTSVFFWFMNHLYNQARFALGMGAALNGTGIMYSTDFIRRNGIDTSSLTEDLEMVAQAVLAGEKIAWMPEAITFDEQPVTLRDSFTQRRRWASGSFQCFLKYERRLLFSKGLTRDRFDISMIFLGILVQLLGVIPVLVTIGMGIGTLATDPVKGVMTIAFVLLSAVVGMFLSGVLFATLVMLIAKKRPANSMRVALSMGMFLLTWMPANLSAIMTRPPKWVQIAHVSMRPVEACEAEHVAPPVPFQQQEKETGSL